ncbi:MAG TPA: hypothetical protein VN607_05460, partial [Gemmatimonadaceae bacterium]|nr:hypothetical protein [Gemmatimonadaceae bacterium]
GRLLGVREDRKLQPAVADSVIRTTTAQLDREFGKRKACKPGPVDSLMGSKAFLPYAETDPGVPAHDRAVVLGDNEFNAAVGRRARCRY